jgi:chemotaxis protein methyltransferase CheR
VMIYFDKSTQNALVDRFYNALEPGGVFMVGHSESLAGVKHGFRYVRPTVYRKS